MRNLALVWVLAGVAVVLLAAGDGKPPVSTYTDKRDGKVYRIVKIGSQTWFAENLNYAAKGSKCYKNSPDSCAKYGRLYNWETALKACPAGTHLPTDEEWQMLKDYIGGSAKKLKSASGWKDYEGKSGNGTNEYGFSALPGGRGGFGVRDDIFTDVNYGGFWWSATPFKNYYVMRQLMCYNCESVISRDDHKALLYSVRCVQDDEKEKQK
jgi:uncharacterized protein (TIGR02145 family)